MNQTLLGGARALMQHSGMSKGFWAEAMGMAAHIANRSPRKGLGWKTPHELLFGRTPDVSYFRIFGCRAWVFNEHGKKWDPKANPMVFIGYENGSKAFRLWNPKTRSVVVSANVRFDETAFPYQPPAKSSQPTSDSIPVPSSSKTKQSVGLKDIPWSLFDEDPPKPSTPSPPSPPNDSDSDFDSAELFDDQNRDNDSTPPPPSKPPTPSPAIPTSESDPDLPEPSSSKDPEPRRSMHTRTQTQKYVAGTSSLKNISSEGDLTEQDLAYLSMVELYTQASSVNEPRSHTEAMESPDSVHWKEAEAAEIKSLEDRETWEVVPRPENINIVSCKWVY